MGEPSHPVADGTPVEGERGMRRIVLREPITAARTEGKHEVEASDGRVPASPHQACLSTSPCQVLAGSYVGEYIALAPP